MSHTTTTIAGHTVAVTGPYADALTKRLMLCLARFEGVPTDHIEAMPSTGVGGLAYAMRSAAEDDAEWDQLRADILSTDMPTAH